MKKILFIAATMLLSISASAQVMKVKQNGKIIATYKGANYEFVFEESAPKGTNILNGEFSVSDTKQVQFTKGNLYWDGSNFYLEDNQYDYPSKWNTNHVGHFYWTKTAETSYAMSYSVDDEDFTDKFWLDGCDADHMLTIDGTDGLYALSRDEWYYLITTRDNAAKLYKPGVEVAGIANCLIIAPDTYDYTTTPIQSSYTADAWAAAEANGLVCLPAVGTRNGDYISDCGVSGDYWTSYQNSKANAYNIYFRSDCVESWCGSARTYAYSLRLVR